VPEWAQVAVGVAALWLVLVVALVVELRRHPDRLTLRELLGLAPDVARLLIRLIRDPGVGAGLRICLLAMTVYLLSPLDLIPDVIPVVGQLDDALIVAIALRMAVRLAGGPAMERHWPGTAAGLQTVLRLAGIPGGQRHPTSESGETRPREAVDAERDKSHAHSDQDSHS